MITSLPLCEVESFSMLGVDDNWVDKGDGMGNGSIFVTIRCVGRCKIVDSDLIQEHPYMLARVVEILDDDINVAPGKGSTGLEDNFVSGPYKGESSPLDIANLLGDNIELLMQTLSDMESQLKDKKLKEKGEVGNDDIKNRKLVNAQLESLFLTDGVDVQDSLDEDEDEDNEEDEYTEGSDKLVDRYEQFKSVMEEAKDSDSQGYVIQQTDANDKLPQSKKRSKKELVAMSWAAFCTGNDNNVQHDVIKIQALDITNVIQRLQLASAMLRDEKKKLTMIALGGILKDGGDDEQ